MSRVCDGVGHSLPLGIGSFLILLLTALCSLLSLFLPFHIPTIILIQIPDERVFRITSYVAVQSLSGVRLFETPWTAAR